MEDTKKTVLAGNGEKDVPRAVYDGVLTINVDAHVESMEEQEEARWHQLLNAHRTRKIMTGQLGGIEKLESGWMVAVTYFNGFRIIIQRGSTYHQGSYRRKEIQDDRNKAGRWLCDCGKY